MLSFYWFSVKQFTEYISVIEFLLKICKISVKFVISLNIVIENYLKLSYIFPQICQFKKHKCQCCGQTAASSWGLVDSTAVILRRPQWGSRREKDQSSSRRIAWYCVVLFIIVNGWTYVLRSALYWSAAHGVAMGTESDAFLSSSTLTFKLATGYPGIFFSTLNCHNFCFIAFIDLKFSVASQLLIYDFLVHKL